MIIIDTNIYIAYLNSRDQNHNSAKEIVKKILSGELGRRFTISEVFSEVSTLLFRQTKNKNIVEKAWKLFYDPKFAWASTIIVSKEIITEAWSIFQKYVNKKVPLSFVDCLLISTAKINSIEFIASFDSEFDGILKRIF